METKQLYNNDDNSNYIEHMQALINVCDFVWTGMVYEDVLELIQFRFIQK